MSGPSNGADVVVTRLLEHGERNTKWGNSAQWKRSRRSPIDVHKRSMRADLGARQRQTAITLAEGPSPCRPDHRCHSTVWCAAMASG